MQRKERKLKIAFLLKTIVIVHPIPFLKHYALSFTAQEVGRGVFRLIGAEDRIRLWDLSIYPKAALIPSGFR